MILGNHPFSKQKFFFGIKLSSLQPPPFFDYLWGSQKDLGVSKIYPVINIKSLDSNPPPPHASLETFEQTHISDLFNLASNVSRRFKFSANFANVEHMNVRNLEQWKWYILESMNIFFCFLGDYGNWTSSCSGFQVKQETSLPLFHEYVIVGIFYDIHTGGGGKLHRKCSKVLGRDLLSKVSRLEV